MNDLLFFVIGVIDWVYIQASMIPSDPPLLTLSDGSPAANGPTTKEVRDRIRKKRWRVPL